MTFELLAKNIEAIHLGFAEQAAHAVNLSLTSRNWLMGCHIVEFEQNGEDRAQYGAKLLKRLEERLHTKGLTERRFREFRRLYLVYTQLGKEVLNYVGAQQIDAPLALPDTIRRLMSAESENAIIRRMTSAELEQQTWQDKFKHEYASQMNMYINYYKHEVMTADDNPPIGLLLCTDYSETVVKYATGGLDPNLFVQKYHIQLPSEAELKAFIAQSIRGTE